MRQGSRVQQVCKRKETTWSDLDRVQKIGSRARDTQPIRGVSDDTACKEVHNCSIYSSDIQSWRKPINLNSETPNKYNI